MIAQNVIRILIDNEHEKAETIVQNKATHQNLIPHNIEFSCRPESGCPAPVQQIEFVLNRLHPGGQLQRFVMAPSLQFVQNTCE
jgi:hypothetical protein